MTTDKQTNKQKLITTLCARSLSPGASNLGSWYKAELDLYLHYVIEH